MSWYKFSLTKDEVVSGKHRKAQDLFTECFTQYGGPKKLALFSATMPDGSLTLYLHIPPDFGLMEKIYSQIYPLTPCDKPSSTGLAFLAGHDEDKALAMA
jgi:hypothetical protein